MMVANRNRHKSKQWRSGFTLLETGLALAVVSVMLVTITSLVVHGQQMRLDAERLSLAATLAQVKMAQLLSNPHLTTQSEEGQMGSDSGAYADFSYIVRVREEQMDLAEVMMDGRIASVAEAPSLDDRLPADVQNLSDRQRERLEERGIETATGGLVDIVRVVVEIGYPIGGDQRRSYRVETLRSTAARGGGR